jgi:ribosome biogenesis GTPase / thiamine phosphate phosphatase
MTKGLVIKSTGSWYEIHIGQNEKVLARLKGVLRLDESKDTNPVAVGDNVLLEKDAETSDWMIAGVEDRTNYIVRSSPKHKGARHVIAANIDQCILIGTIDVPRTSTGFIDRFLMAAEAYQIPTIIVLNKQDLLDGKGLRKQENLISIYSNIGYRIVLTSVEKNIGIQELSDALTNKTSLIFGHSGVGKSSLMNKINPELNLRTGGLSRFANRGMHTTTFAEMFFLNENTKIIDTPGVREFAHMNMAPEEISHYFKEMRELLPKCKFNNCTHTDEPNCAVKEAWMNGEISEERYKNYLNIYEEIKANYKHWE